MVRASVRSSVAFGLNRLAPTGTVATFAPATSGWGFSMRREVRRTAPFCIAYYWLAIATPSATHAADCVFTQFSASRPALICRLARSCHRAIRPLLPNARHLQEPHKISEFAPSRFHPPTHDGPSANSSALFGLITQDTSKLEDAQSAGAQKRLGL